MDKRLKRSIFFLLFSASISAQQYSDKISGNYLCYSYDKKHEVILTCQMNFNKVGRTYANQASCSDGTFYQGTAIYDAQKKVLALVAVDTSNANETGVALITIHDKKLVYKFTYLNQKTLGHIHCTKTTG